MNQRRRIPSMGGSPGVIPYGRRELQAPEKWKLRDGRFSRIHNHSR